MVAVAALLPAYVSCTKDQDTEPFVPSLPGATQPVGSGDDLLSEDDACERLLSAATAAYEKANCPFEPVECPAFIRPAGASGCYEYSEDSLKECESTYESAGSVCSNLGPCVVTAVENTSLSSCVLVDGGEGGAAGQGSGGSPGSAGAGAQGGAPGGGGAPGDAGSSSGGQDSTPPSGGAGAAP
jgi:hypothetical protein